MAQVIGTFIQNLELNNRQFLQAAAGSDKAAKGLAKSIGGITPQMAAVGAGAAVFGALAFELTKAARAAIGFQKAVSEVRTIASRTEFPLQRIQKISKDLNETYAGGAEGQAKSLYQAISAGATSAAEAVSTLDVANRLAVAGITEVAGTIDVLTSVVNSYGREVLSAAKASDIMFTTVRLGKTTVEELQSTMGTIAPMASQLGISFEEVNAAIAALTANGVATSDAITQLSSVFTAALKQTKKSQEVQEELGIEFNETTLAAKGLVGSLEELQEAGATASQLQRLFGRVEATRGAMALMKNEGEKVKRFLEEMRFSAGATDKAFAIMAETMDFQAKRLAASWQNVRITVGEFAQSELAVDAVKAITSSINLLNRTLEGTAEYLDSPEMKLFLEWADSGWRLMTFMLNPSIEKLGEFLDDAADPLEKISEAMEKLGQPIQKNTVRFKQFRYELGESNEEQKEFVDTIAPGVISSLNQIAEAQSGVIEMTQRTTAMSRTASTAWLDYFMQLEAAVGNLGAAMDTLGVRITQNLVGNLSQGLTNAIFDAENAAAAFKRMGLSIGRFVVGSLIKMGLQLAINATIGKAVLAASKAGALGAIASQTAASATAGATASAAWLPAATFASTATFGGAAGAGAAALQGALGATGGAAVLQAGILKGALAGIGAIGHGGITSTREGATYLSAKERVLAPPQNRDLIEFMKGGGTTVNVHNYSNAQVRTEMTRDGIEVIIEEAVATVLEVVNERGGLAS